MGEIYRLHQHRGVSHALSSRSSASFSSLSFSFSLFFSCSCPRAQSISPINRHAKHTARLVFVQAPLRSLPVSAAIAGAAAWGASNPASEQIVYAPGVRLGRPSPANKKERKKEKEPQKKPFVPGDTQPINLPRRGRMRASWVTTLPCDGLNHTRFLLVGD